MPTGPRQDSRSSPICLGLVSTAATGWNNDMVSIDGKLIDPWHVELAEPVPTGEEAIQVRLVESKENPRRDVPLLTRNPSFDFLCDEPDLYP